MALSPGDYKAVLELTEIAHNIPDRAIMLEAFFERLAKVVPFSSVVLLAYDPLTSQFQFQDYFLLYAGLRELELYLDHYAPLDPFVLTDWTTAHINATARFTDVVPRSYLLDSEYGRDFLPKVPFFHGLGIYMASQGDSVGALGLHRQRDDRNFADREKEIMNYLAPHLARALHTLSLIKEFTAENHMGVIRIDGNGERVIMNEEARRALDGQPVSALPNPELGTSPLLFNCKRGTFRVRTVALHAFQEKIILLEPYPPDWTLKPRFTPFGLSPRQREIVLLVIRGLSNREIAERLFITEQTVKDHLHDIFEKVQVRRRSELVAKVLGVLPLKKSSS